MRQTHEEKRKAAARVCIISYLMKIKFLILLFKAKLLEQMDEEFGVGNLINEEAEKRKQKVIVSVDISFHFRVYLF